MSQFIRPLKNVTNHDVAVVGGKAASLGEMLGANIAVPPGFVITTEAFRAGMSADLEKEILAAFDALGAERVAVRSSAVAEDSGAASWAGQLDTYLNTTRNDVIEAVQNCWQSMQSDHAQDYAKEHKVTEADQAVAVVVQAMVDSDIAGVMFTANPINQSREEAIIEAGYGLGELLVQGMITPENVIINKATSQVTYRQNTKQREKLIYQNGSNQQVPVPADSQEQPILTDQHIKQLIDVAAKIEQHYGTPQDIEWAIANDQLYIVQSRPITTLNEESSEPVPSAQPEDIEWQHYLTRRYTLFGASLWQQTYNSNEFSQVFGVKLPFGLYVEDQPGIVRLYRRPRS